MTSKNSTVVPLSLGDMVLMGLYIGAELTANVTEAKAVLLWGLSVDGGTLIYALTFTLLDLFHEKHGKRAAQRLVYAAVAANLLLAVYVHLTVQLPYPSFFEDQEAYRRVLGATPRFVAASLIAFLLASLADTEVYAWLKTRVQGHRWLLVLGSNAVATLLDSVIFITLAFYGRFPLWPLIIGNFTIKMVVTVLSLPLIYARRRS